jgi:hypothetical protein
VGRVSSSDLLADGIRIRDRGLRVYPVGSDKQPIRGHQWGPWRINPPAPDDQIRLWATDPKTHGWAVLCGARDDGIACNDIEADGMAVPEVAAITARAPLFCQYESKSGGVHLWLDITDHDTAGPLLIESLAKVTNGDLDEHGNLVWTLLAEIRGASSKPENHGAYAVVVGPGRPPLRDDWRPWKITRAEAEALLQPIRDLDQSGPWKADRNAERARNRATRPTVAPTGDTTASVILEALKSRWLDPTDVLPDGWEYVGDDGPRQLIRRPGGKSPVSGNVLDGITVVHSTAVGWATPGEGMPPAKLLAEGRHGGDFAAAMAEVEKAARGEPSDYSHWPRAVLDRVAEVANNNRERWEAEQAAKLNDWTAAAAPPTSDADQSRPQSFHVGETGNTGKTGDTAPKLWAATDLKPSAPTRWMVRGHLPLGNVAVLIGDEGIGKSLWWVLVVAHISTGTGDDRLGIPPSPPRDSILVLTEDSWTGDVRPRLEAAGADLSRVHVLAEDQDGTGTPLFPRDFKVISEAAPNLDLAFIVADAWLDTVKAGLQVKDPQQARQALNPWRTIAQETRASVLLLAHSNRADDGNLRNRVGATGALRQKARVLLYAAQPPEQEGVLYLGPDKANGAGKANAVAYRIEVEQVRPATDDDPGTIAKLGITGATDSTMEGHYAAWRADQRKAEHPDASERAWQWLRTYVDTHGQIGALGLEVRAEEAKAAAQASGVNAKLLARVVKAHGGYVGPDGVGGAWIYRLHETGQSRQSSQSRQSHRHGKTGRNTGEDPETRLPTEDTDTATTSDHACAGPGICRTSGCAASEQVA